MDLVWGPYHLMRKGGIPCAGMAQHNAAMRRNGVPCMAALKDGWKAKEISLDGAFAIYGVWL